MTATPAAVLLRFPPLADGTVPARVVVAGAESTRRDFAFVALHASRIERAAAESENAYHDLCVAIHSRPFDAGARHLLPAGFTDRKRVHVCDVRLDGRSLPGDFDRNPPDLRELSLRIDGDTGSATTESTLANDPIDRAHVRIGELRKRGAFEVRAVVVRANADLFEPFDEDGHAFVLVTFDPTAEVVPYFKHVASYLEALAGGTFRDDDKAAVAAMLADPRFVRDRRRRLPGRVTDEQSIYLCDLLVHRPFLRDGVLADGPLHCLADPGPWGRIELLPAAES